MKRLALILLALSPLALASPPLQPFQADFTVLRNGSEVGEARMQLSQEGPNDWRLHATLNAAAAGGLLQFSSVEDSRFHWHQGQPRSDRYHARRQQPLRTRERSIEFDWNAGRVTMTDHRDREQNFSLDGEGIDPQLVLLVSTLAAAEGHAEFDYVIVNRGAPERQQGRREGTESIDTGVGTVTCVDMERVRESRRRETRSCHAQALDWLPVRIVQIEDGDVLELRLRALSR
jgi:hypothetical protein